MRGMDESRSDCSSSPGKVVDRKPPISSRKKLLRAVSDGMESETRWRQSGGSRMHKERESVSERSEFLFGRDRLKDLTQNARSIFDKENVSDRASQIIGRSLRERSLDRFESSLDRIETVLEEFGRAGSLVRSRSASRPRSYTGKLQEFRNSLSDERPSRSFDRFSSYDGSCSSSRRTSQSEDYPQEPVDELQDFIRLADKTQALIDRLQQRHILATSRSKENIVSSSSTENNIIESTLNDLDRITANSNMNNNWSSSTISTNLDLNKQSSFSSRQTLANIDSPIFTDDKISSLKFDRLSSYSGADDYKFDDRYLPSTSRSRYSAFTPTGEFGDYLIGRENSTRQYSRSLSSTESKNDADGKIDYFESNESDKSINGKFQISVKSIDKPPLIPVVSTNYETNSSDKQSEISDLKKPPKTAKKKKSNDKEKLPKLHIDIPNTEKQLPEKNNLSTNNNNYELPSTDNTQLSIIKNDMKLESIDKVQTIDNTATVKSIVKNKDEDSSLNRNSTKDRLNSIDNESKLNNNTSCYSRESTSNTTIDSSNDRILLTDLSLSQKDETALSKFVSESKLKYHNNEVMSKIVCENSSAKDKSFKFDEKSSEKDKIEKSTLPESLDSSNLNLNKALPTSDNNSKFNLNESFSTSQMKIPSNDDLDPNGNTELSVEMYKEEKSAEIIEESNKTETKKMKKVLKKSSTEESNKEIKVLKKKSVKSPIEESKPSDEIVVPKKKSVKMKKTTSKETVNSDIVSTSSNNKTDSVSLISQKIPQAIDPSMSSVDLQTKSIKLLNKNNEQIDYERKLENEMKKKGEISSDIGTLDQIKTEIVMETKKIDLKNSENKTNDCIKTENKVIAGVKLENKTLDTVKSEISLESKKIDSNKAICEAVKSETLSETKKSESKLSGTLSEIKKIDEIKPEDLLGNTKIVSKNSESLPDSEKIESELSENNKAEPMISKAVSERKKIKQIKSDTSTVNKRAVSENVPSAKKVEKQNEKIEAIKSESLSENKKGEPATASDTKKIKPNKSENNVVEIAKSETSSENKKIPRPNDIPIFNKFKKDEMNSSDRSKLSNPEEVKVFDKVSESMSVSESGDITVICKLKKRNSLTRKTEGFNKLEYFRSLSNPEDKSCKSDLSPTSDKSPVKKVTSITNKTTANQISTEKSNTLSISHNLDEISSNISTLPPIPSNSRKDVETSILSVNKKDVQSVSNQLINLTSQTLTNETNRVDDSTSQKLALSLVNSNKDHVDESPKTSIDKLKLSNSSAENGKSEGSMKINDLVSVKDDENEVTKKKSPRVIHNKDQTAKKSTVKESSEVSNENIDEETLKKEKVSGIARRSSPKLSENTTVRKSPPSNGAKEDSPKSERAINRRQSPTSIPVKKVVKNTEYDVKIALNNRESSPKIMGSSSGDIKRRPSPKTVNIDSVLRRKWSPKENKSRLTHSTSSEVGSTIEQQVSSPKKSSSSDRIKKVSPPKFEIPKKDVKREISPKKDINRAISPIKRGISPKKDYKKEVNISTTTDKEISPSNNVKREISPIKRRMSPKKDVKREISPKKDASREISPIKREISPKVDYRKDVKSSTTFDKVSSTKEPKREISPRKTYARESPGKKESMRNDANLQSTSAKEKEERISPTDKRVLKKDNLVEQSISSKVVLSNTVISDNNKEVDNRSELERRRTSLKLPTVTKEESILRKPIALRMNLSKFGVPQQEVKRRSIKEKDMSSRSFGTDREDTASQLITEKNGIDPVKTPSSDEYQKKTSENDEQPEKKIVKKTRIVRKVKSDSAKSALEKIESDKIQEIMNQSYTEKNQNGSSISSLQNQSEFESEIILDKQTKIDSVNSSVTDNKSLLKRLNSKSFPSSIRDETSAFVKFQKYSSDSLKSPTLESDQLKSDLLNIKTSKDSIRSELNELVKKHSDSVKTSSGSVKSHTDSVKTSIGLMKSDSDSVKARLDSGKSNTDLDKTSTVSVNPSAALVKPSSTSIETSSGITCLNSSVKSSVVSDKTKSDVEQSIIGTLISNPIKSDADLNLTSVESVRTSSESVCTMSKSVKKSSASVNSVTSIIDSVDASSSKSPRTTATDLGNISSELINSSSDSVSSNMKSVKNNYISVTNRLDSIKSSTDSVNTLSSKSVRNSSTDLDQNGTELFHSRTDSSSTIPKSIQKNNSVIGSSKSRLIADLDELSSEYIKKSTDSVSTSSKSVEKISVSVQENIESTESVSTSSKSDKPVADLKQLSTDYIKSSTDSVNSSLKSIKNSASSVKSSNGIVKSSADSMQVSTNGVKLSSSVKSNVDSVKSSTDSVKYSTDSMQVCTNAAKFSSSVKSTNSVRICSDLAKLDYSNKGSPDREKLISNKVNSDNAFTDSVTSRADSNKSSITNSVRICSDLAKLDYSDKGSPDRVKLTSKKVSSDNVFTDSVKLSADSLKSSTTNSVRICSDLAKLDYSDKGGLDRVKLASKKVSSDNGFTGSVNLSTSVKPTADSVKLRTETEKMKLNSTRNAVSVDVSPNIGKSSSDLEKISTDLVNVVTSSVKSGNNMEKVSRDVENTDSVQVSRDSVTKSSSSVKSIGDTVEDSRESGFKISTVTNSSDDMDSSRLKDLRKNRDYLSLDLKSVSSSSVNTVKKKRLVKKSQVESGQNLNSDDLPSPSEKSVLEKFLELKPKESRIEKTIKSLRRNSLGQTDVFTESKLLKRATSMEDFKSCSDLTPSPANYNSDEEVFKKKKKGKIRKGSVYDAIQSRILKGKTENVKDVPVKIENEENTSKPDAGESHSSSSNQNDFTDDANSFSLDNSSELGSLALESSTEVEERIKRKSFYTRFNPSCSKITFKRYY